MAELRVKTPITDEDICRMKLGDNVFLTGVVHTAKDEAHGRILEYLSQGRKIPFDLNGGVIFHCGPIAKKINGRWSVVSAGPTTSSRMNRLQPEVLEKCGVKAVIGKGGMSEDVLKSLKNNNAVYLAVTGGAAALISERIKKVLAVNWLDVGMPEAVWALEVKDLGPLTVAMINGKSLYSGVERRVSVNLNRLIQNL
jgi:fumarate hydratase subunit beta